MSGIGQRRNHHGNGLRTGAQRFPKSKQCDTGIDPERTFVNFIKYDARQNIDLNRDNGQRRENLDKRKNFYAIGCTKKVRDTTSHSQPPYRFHSTTDHISYLNKDANSIQPFANVTKECLNKPKFNKSQRTSEVWMPKRVASSLNNCQSTKYDIITHQENPNAIVRRTTNIDARKFKGITEIQDKQRIYNPNWSQDYQNALQQDGKVFYRKTGIFTHIYDAAARQGNIIVPFERNKELSEKPTFKC